ncbi:DNA polymerase III delta' subunit [Mycoplasma putrefaciens]|uniref:DNA polymerase III delta' subunit n=1 Tax=Mycoplasma putrefaciens (strain ATCC 15718 / NCTC 10155 / C30 KS-1 / KS-1) TaxID=743965 RepID=A0A7U4E9L1_MYCPK|nr:DNA polymerase III subunit delta [Mycoplasma putrefaciens]AEM69049.1 DNA polymerase III delta' subunit [Mycoplasma putrefaciens KS1]SYV96657.1 DNA polymerase III delta' subunit [Mycoplasma putrefaciens]
MKKEQVLNRLKQMIDNNNLFSNIILNTNNNEIGLEIISETIAYAFCKNSANYNFEKIKKQVLENKHIDVMFIGNSSVAITNKEVNELIEKMSLSATGEQNLKFFIIRNAENLKSSAANSILKFLEEPPVNTYGFLLTNNYSEILTTILSRCQLINIENKRTLNSEINVFEQLLISKNKEQILLFNNQLKSMTREEQIKLVTDAYHKTIIHKFYNLIEPTLEFLDDLKFLPITTVAIDNYLIRICEEI